MKHVYAVAKTIEGELFAGFTEDRDVARDSDVHALVSLPKIKQMVAVLTFDGKVFLTYRQFLYRYIEIAKYVKNVTDNDYFKNRRIIVC